MKKSFAHGAMTLGAAGLLCSAVGSLFRIALAGCIGTSGIAYYQLAYPVYVLMTVIATTGIPAAIRLVPVAPSKISGQQAGFGVCGLGRLQDGALLFCDLF